MSDREPSCTGCGAVAGADGRCSYCRERFGDSDATLSRLALAVTAVAKRLPHVIEGDPAGYHAGLVEAFDGLTLALQGVPAPGERTP